MEKSIIIIPIEGGFEISIPIEAVRVKNLALSSALLVTQVTNPEEQSKAISSVAELKGLSRGMEAARTEEKKPYLETGRAIDAKAKEYSESIDKRAADLERMIGAYQKAEREKAEALRRAEEKKKQDAADELARQQRERDQAELRRIDAEKADTDARERREQSERDAAAANTPEAKAQAAAGLKRQIEAEAAAQIAYESAHAAAVSADIDAAEAREDAELAAAQTVVVYSPEKVSGVSVSEKTEFEITDIEAVYAWDLYRRDRIKEFQGRAPLLTIIEMTIRKAPFRALIATLSPDEIASIPGVTFSQSTKASVKASTPVFGRILTENL